MFVFSCFVHSISMSLSSLLLFRCVCVRMCRRCVIGEQRSTERNVSVWADALSDSQ